MRAHAEYIGCFKVRDNSENRLRLRTHRWYDPHHDLMEGDASHYAEGPFYVLPGPVVDGIVRSGLTVRMGGPNEGDLPPAFPAHTLHLSVAYAPDIKMLWPNSGTCHQAVLHRSCKHCTLHITI